MGCGASAVAGAVLPTPLSAQPLKEAIDEPAEPRWREVSLLTTRDAEPQPECLTIAQPGTTCVSWSPSGNRLAIGADAVTIFSATSGATQQNVSLEILCEHTVLCSSWAPSGAHVAVACEGSDCVNICGVNDPTQRLAITVEATSHSGTLKASLRASAVQDIAWSPDSTQIAMAIWGSHVQIRDAATGFLLRSWVSGGGSIVALRWSPCGARIAAGCSDGRACVWAANCGACERVFEASEDDEHSDPCPINSIAWSPSSTALAVATSKGVALWYVSSGEPIADLTVGSAASGSGVACVAWAPDGSYIAGCAVETIVFWSPTSGDCVVSFDTSCGAISSLAWSPKATSLASVSEEGVKVWDVASILTTTPRGRGGQRCSDGEIAEVAWSPKGTHLVTCSHTGTLRMWDTRSCELLHTLAARAGRTHGPSCVVWDADGSAVSIAGTSNAVGRWDVVLGSWAVDSRFKAWPQGTIALAWAHDGARLASSNTYDASIGIWNVATGKRTGLLTGHEAPVTCAAWSPNNAQLASGSTIEACFRLWNIPARSCLATVSCSNLPRTVQSPASHEDAALFLAWTQDGQQLVVGDGGQLLWVLKGPKGASAATLTSQRRDVLCAACSKTGRFVAAGCRGGDVCVWDLASAQEVACLKGHSGAVSSIAWSGDSLQLASGDVRSGVRVWSKESA